MKEWLNKIHNMDCLEGMKKLPDNSIDLIVTDPPYNTGLDENNRGRLEKFFNDNYSPQEYMRLVSEWSRIMFKKLKQGGAIYLFINWKSYPIWYDFMNEHGFNIKNCIVWDKKLHGLNFHNYAYKHEFCIFAVKGDKFKVNPRSRFKTDIWAISRHMGAEMEQYSHETVKPLAIIREMIKHGSKENDIVLDCFIGSGTTAVACKELNRNFIGFEIMPEYCEIAEYRLKAIPKRLTLFDKGGIKK